MKTWSYCWKKDRHVTRKYLERIAPKGVIFDFPLNSRIQDGYQTMTFEMKISPSNL